jgi:hypothetical protein
VKITNGKIVILIGIIHTLFTLLPFVYGKQFMNFAHQYFFKINNGFLESGQMDYETFAAFWCFFFGILLFPLGILLEYTQAKLVLGQLSMLQKMQLSPNKFF